MSGQPILRKMLHMKILMEKKFFSRLFREKLIKNFQIVFKKKIPVYDPLKMKKVVTSHLLSDFEFFLLKTNTKIKFHKDLYRNALVQERKNSTLLSIFLIFLSESKKIFSFQRFFRNLSKNNYCKELIRYELIFFKKILLCFKRYAKKNKIKYTITLIFKKIFSFIFLGNPSKFHIFLHLIYKESFFSEVFSQILFLTIFFQKKKKIWKNFFNFIQFNKNLFSNYPASSSVKNTLYYYSYMSLNDIWVVISGLYSKTDVYSDILYYEKRNQNQFLKVCKYSF
jgi:hypothetical protein